MVLYLGIDQVGGGLEDTLHKLNKTLTVVLRGDTRNRSVTIP
jgi:hypothetical protein